MHVVVASRLRVPDVDHSRPTRGLSGALDLVESILCVPDAEIDRCTERYQRYGGYAARNDGVVQVFHLRESRVRLVPASALETVLPGEKAPTLPSFVGYGVAVRDLDFAQRSLDS